MNKIGLAIILLFLLSPISFSQRLISAHSRTDQIIERSSIKSGENFGIHSAIRNQDERQVLDFVLESIEKDSIADPWLLKDWQYIINDHYPKLCFFPDSIYQNNRPFLKYFYSSKSKLFTYSNDDLQIEINPVVNLSMDSDLYSRNYFFQNTRGIKVSGKIFSGISFYSSLYENQRSFPAYLESGIESRKAIPGQGFYKSYISTLNPEIRGYDYMNAQAYVGINLTKNIDIHFGHSNFFIGNGIRSLLLSDYGHNYLFLKVDSRFGKLHYQNLFAELTGASSAQLGSDVLLPKKYMAAHYLSYQLLPNLELGMFESVIFRRENGFELQYLNPIILYRSVEQFTGSPDNILIGLNIRWDLFKTIRMYGQLSLDEFKFREIINKEGWWGNKYGFQLGMKYIDVAGIDHLDIQLEMNTVRPYTYSHQDSLISYSHYNQAMAHPLGANFREYLVNIRYQASSNIFLNANLLWVNQGVDESGGNSGSNILLSSNSREMEYNNVTAQGIPRLINQIRFQFSWSFYHNYFLDLNLSYRSETVGELEQRFFLIGPGLRINIDQQLPDY